MQQYATTPLTIHQIWSNGLQLARERWRQLYFIFIVNQLIILLSVYLFANPNKSLSAIFRDHPGNTLIYFIAASLIILFIYALCFQHLGSVLQGKNSSIKDSMRNVVRKFPILIVASILSLFVCALGFVAFVIPGIFIAVNLFYYYPAIIVDEKTPIDALKYTLKLVWGNWWRSFYVVFGPMFIAGIIGGLISLIIFMFSLFIPGLSTISDYLNNIINLLFQAYVNVIIIAIQLIQWNDLKVRKALSLN